MSAADVREPLGQQLAQHLAWLDDPAAPRGLRDLARQVTPLLLDHVADERTLTDVMAVLRRAVARGDFLPLGLVHELPVTTGHRGYGTVAPELALGNYALRIGATEPLLDIAQATLVHGRVEVPAAWVCAVLDAESGPVPRSVVIALLDEWLDQEYADPTSVDRVLRHRPALLATCYVDAEGDP